jgi:hypothetical protein
MFNVRYFEKHVLQELGISVRATTEFYHCKFLDNKQLNSRACHIPQGQGCEENGEGEKNCIGTCAKE